MSLLPHRCQEGGSNQDATGVDKSIIILLSRGGKGVNTRGRAAVHVKERDSK